LFCVPAGFLFSGACFNSPELVQYDNYSREYVRHCALSLSAVPSKADLKKRVGVSILARYSLKEIFFLNQRFINAES